MLDAEEVLEAGEERVGLVWNIEKISSRLLHPPLPHKNPLKLVPQNSGGDQLTVDREKTRK